MYLYVFGNGNLSFDRFTELYVPPMLKAVQQDGVGFIVCDFRGTDTLAMEFLKDLTIWVDVFHVGEKPRYLPNAYKTEVERWNLCGRFTSDRRRDYKAIEKCTHFLAYDFNSTEDYKTGTQHNIEKCLELGKVRYE